MRKKLDMLNGPLVPTLSRMTSSNLLAVISLLAFQLTDAFFISRLGSDALAAFGLTLAPTLMTISIALGLGSGVSVNLARLLGQNKQQEAKQFVSHALLLTLLISVSIALLGIATIKPLFALLGADASLLPLFHDYMFTWYAGITLLILQIQANQALRASGYTLAPALVTILIAVTNGILDPLLIFGIGPFPELGFHGAAVATFMAWVVSFSAAAYLLLIKHKLPSKPQFTRLRQHWRELLHIARPCTLSNLLNPAAGAVLIALMARIDTHAVAALGVGMRIEGVMLIAVTALSGTLTPFLAQNIGAGQMKRAFHALFSCLQLLLLWQMALYLLVWLCSSQIAALFAVEAETGQVLSQYLLWLPASYGLLAVVILYSVLLNAQHLPLKALSLNIIRLGTLLPAAFVGQYVAGAQGVFIAMTAANCFAGLVCWQLAKRRAAPWAGADAASIGL
ncbi:MATE family efflux transporter [uncultured Ferrimonas sp.]|uniref:MATE family efflux transporter n=1 Tax=uncultured Ferrimonas sp. TaxID=432640 RepID=UPI0026266CB6|nr:MATE family efflux transporter [uncultured Ferrimonas sp.]